MLEKFFGRRVFGLSVLRPVVMRTRLVRTKEPDQGSTFRWIMLSRSPCSIHLSLYRPSIQIQIQRPLCVSRHFRHTSTGYSAVSAIRSMPRGHGGTVDGAKVAPMRQMMLVDLHVLTKTGMLPKKLLELFTMITRNRLWAGEDLR